MLKINLRICSKNEPVEYLIESIPLYVKVDRNEQYKVGLMYFFSIT
jgi:hypothetical protein